MTIINAGLVVTTGGSPISAGDKLYTCPAATGAVVHGLFISNVDGGTSATVTIQVYDNSATTLFTLGKNLPVPAQGTLIFDKPINLMVADYLLITASIDGDIEAFASILEQAV